MMAPKNILEAKKTVSPELASEIAKAKDMLFDTKVSDAEANAFISEVNAKILAAGLPSGMKVVVR